MIRNLIACSLLFAAMLRLEAQPVLDGSCAPVPGTNYTLVVAGSIDLPGMGPDQVWNAAGAVVSGTEQIGFIEAELTFAGTFFPTADVANSLGQIETFIDIADDGLYIVGTYNGSFPFISTYTDPNKYLQFPCELGDAWTDTYAGSYTYGGVTYTQSGSGVFSATGFGSLVLPWGTVTNVLRIDATEVYSETGNGNLYEYEAEVSYFYKPGVGHYVAKSADASTTFNGNSTGSSANFVFLDGSTVGILDQPDRSIGIEVYPNPVGSNATLLFTAAGARSLQVFNADGKLVLDQPLTGYGAGLHKLGIDVHGWASGVYSAVLLGVGGERGVTRFVVAP
ncbi:MAG: T9SS type A sorting domain-containing protein [Flavobacteriales bacterium]|nr:T9SS type A sorting domain-containing protein [Flavobacteriales bacterium]